MALRALVRSSWLVLLLSTSILGSAFPGLTPSAAAQPALDAQQAEAQALFRRGVELGELDRWADALEHFRRSAAIARRPNTVFNIAFASQRLGRFRDALAAFDEYLGMTEGETSERRTEAVRLRAEALTSLAELRVEVDPPDATLLVDGEPDPGTGAARQIALDPGRHVLRASAEGHDEASMTVSVLAGEHMERRIALTPRGGTGGPVTPAGPGLLEDPVFWIVAGAVVVAAGVGIGVGVGVANAQGPGPSYGGTTGVVLQALSF